MKIEISKLKTMRGVEGPAYSCDLLADGVLVARVIEDGWGGPLHIDWVRADLKAAVAATAQPIMVARAEADEARKGPSHGLPANWWSDTMKQSAEKALEAYIPTLVEDFEFVKKLKRQMTKEILVRKPKDQPGAYYRHKIAPTAANIAAVKAKPINAGCVVLNERDSSEWISLVGL